MATKIAAWGNSAALRLPKNILDEVSLDIGDQVNVTREGQSIVIKSCKPSLDDLLAQITPENRHKEVFTQSAGHELI